MAKKRSRKKAAYRKRTQNRFSMGLVILVVALLTSAVAVRSAELNRRSDELSEKIESLNAQIALEDMRAVEIENYRKYTQTKRYVEEVAKEKLGLVYEGEIVFKED